MSGPASSEESSSRPIEQLTFTLLDELAPELRGAIRRRIISTDLSSRIAIPTIGSTIAETIELTASPDGLSCICSVHDGVPLHEWIRVELPSAEGPSRADFIFFRRIILEAPLNRAVLDHFTELIAPKLLNFKMTFYRWPEVLQNLLKAKIPVNTIFSAIKTNMISKIYLGGFTTPLDELDDLFECSPIKFAPWLEIYRPVKGLAVETIIKWLKIPGPPSPKRLTIRGFPEINDRPELARPVWTLVDLLIASENEPIQGPGYFVDIHDYEFKRDQIVDSEQISFRRFVIQGETVWRFVRKGPVGSLATLEDYATRIMTGTKKQDDEELVEVVVKREK